MVYTHDGQNDMPAIEQAYQAWSNVLGPAALLKEADALKSYERATLQTQQKVLGVLKPQDLDKLRQCIQIANHFKVPVYPVSQGKNWGYGSRVPVQTDNVILDLSQMNQICDFSEELAYVTIEPGVTYGQLYRFLQTRESNLWIDAMSAGPDASVIGNIMERGWGTTPYADHVEFASGYEVLLANGDLIQTGYGAFGDPKLAALDNWGIGPSLDGLFSQSNLGIVTKLSVWLLPRPEHVQAIFFQLKTDDELSQAVEILRPFKLNDTIGSGPRFTHLYHSLQYNMAYPWEEMLGKPGLSIERAREIGAQLGIAEWNGNLGLFGSEQEVTQRSERIRRALQNIASKVYIVDKKSFDFNKGICLDRPEDRSAADSFLMMTGHIPSPPVRHHWRKRRHIPSKNSPEEDQCGYLFITAVTPFEGREVVRACKMITEGILEYGFEPSAVAYAIRNRNVSIHAGIAFDREVAEEDEAALVCHEKLSGTLYRAGYPPHRLGIQSMGILQEAQPSYKRLLGQIKDAFDPNHILAPGRYEF